MELLNREVQLHSEHFQGALINIAISKASTPTAIGSHE